MMPFLQMMLELLWVGFLIFILLLLLFKTNKQKDCLVLTSFAVYTVCTAEGSLYVTTAMQLSDPAYI